MIRNKRWSGQEIRLGLLLAVGIMMMCCGAMTIRAQESVGYEAVSIPYNGNAYTLHLVKIDLTDPYLRVVPLTAEEGIGNVESFSYMMERSKAVAGINGTFFNAYETDLTRRYPNGFIIRSGELIHSGANQALSILNNKAPQIEYITADMNIIVEHKGAPYTFSAWGVNKYYGTEARDQVILFTRDFGSHIAFSGGTKVVVQENRIVQITSGTAAIPEDGQVIFIGDTDGNNTYILAEMHLGDVVQLLPTVAGSSSEGRDAFNWETAIGAGPRLLTNGEVEIDYVRDGFDDPKITSAANTRSFVGVDKDGRLVMGATVSSISLTDLANVLQQLGLTDAMNMDGGASSGLFYDGSILRSPSRLLNNALIVKRYPEPQVQVAVNNRFVHEFRGYIDQDTTMAPFRGIFERIQAEFQWDGDERILKAVKGAVTLVLRPDDPIAEVNGKPVQLDVAPTIRDGHIYIPLRFVAETLGAEVEWDQTLYRASVTIP